MRHHAVPFIRQDRTMTAWHAAARMLWGFRCNPAIGHLKRAYGPVQGHSPADFVQLAATLGLEPIKHQQASLNVEQLTEWLRWHGPLWIAGYWFGPAHVMVLTGIAGEHQLFFNDPGTCARTLSLTQFNARLAKDVPCPLMYLPVPRARPDYIEHLFVPLHVQQSERESDTLGDAVESEDAPDAS